MSVALQQMGTQTRFLGLVLRLSVAICGCALAGPLAAKGGEGSIPLVREGKAASVVVLPQQVNPLVEQAVQTFVKTVAASTGAEIPVLREDTAAGVDAGVTRLFVGSCQANLALGLDPATLPLETYRLLARGNAIHLVGAEQHQARADESGRPYGWVSRPTLWALAQILEEELQVRWLWPGELGTVIPRHASLAIEPGEKTYQPRLLLRSLRIAASRPLASLPELDARVKEEAGVWAEVHGAGRRGDIRFGHAFSKWWERYSRRHPDYFAYLGKIKQPYLKPASVKLRLSNPKVIEQIAEEYIAEGKPKYFNVCPNDGSGFDIHPDTLAWDIPANQNPKDIISARGELTARYVKFWNLLYKRLVQINPEVILTTYAYSSYRNPPPAERPLEAKAYIGIVASTDSYELWEGWAKQAEGLFLRPNWWHLGADAPYLPLRETYDYVSFANRHGMKGIDMDSVIGYWGTQAANYYLVARLMTRPELSLDEVLGEFTSAFGKGAPKIREYLDYWQKVTSRYDYPINGAKDFKRLNDPNNPYTTLVREGKIPGSILNGAKYALPYLYGDEVLAPAEQLLDEAEALIGRDDKQARERVAFLRKGLLSLRATREQVALGQRLKAEATPEALAAFREGSARLDELREQWSREHVLWGAAATRHENAYKVLIRPENIGFHKINLDGM